MDIAWYSILAFMLTMYVILDGFDLGAGIIHLRAAKDDAERRTILNAIGPVWDGNEVWLIAAGGILYLAFPRVYASAFSGFYLPLMIVLWLLMLRGLGIEFRHRIHHPLWRSFWDAAFALGSTLLALFFGAALGNVVRGVPLRADGYFFEPLWTTGTVVPEAGIIDWFTGLLALVSLCTLTGHGAHYIAMKTSGPVQERARRIAARFWWGMFTTSVLSLVAVSTIRPGVWTNFVEHPWGLLFLLAGGAGLAGGYIFNRRGQDARAFLSSSLFIGGMLAATAFGLYPDLLPASTDPSYSLTVSNSMAHEYSLGVGLVWWTIGIILALGYTVYVFRSHRGKVTAPVEGEGY